MADPRTFKLIAPHMRGDDVETWQRELKKRLDHWGAEAYPLKIDGEHGVATRSATATVLHGMGIAQTAMRNGVTPALRTKVRHSRLTESEKRRHAERADWRKKLAEKWKGGGTAAVLAKIVTHANGWTGPSTHDGVDLICPPDAPGFAICRSKVVRADAGGWWGKGAPSPAIAAKGDGIVVLQSLVSIGPIRKGMLFAYGHAEHPRIDVGDVVNAGDWICRAGMANAPHFHFMVNSGGPKFWTGRRPRGVGDRDPWPLVKFATDNA